MRRFWLKLTLYLGAGAALLLLAAGLAGAIYIYVLSQELPDYQALQSYEPPIATRVHAGDGTLVAEFARERRLFVPIADIPDRVIKAFISAEDRNFYTHPGVDFIGIIRAAADNIWNTMQGRRLEGASTITQQVAKNFLLSSEVSIERKLKEALLSFRIEDAYSKDKILELYLNEIYLGSGSYGVAAAAVNYFDKALDELSIGEAAYLAALPKAPNNYNPVREKERAIERRNWVIEQMYDNAYITRAEADAAKTEDLIVHMRPLGAQNQESQYFAEEVRRIVMERYGERSLYDGGLVVRSTLDPQLQRYAVRAFRDGLIRYDQKHGYRGPVTVIELGEGWEQRLGAVPGLFDVQEWRQAVVLSIAEDKKSARIGFSDGTKGTLPFDGVKWAVPKISDDRIGAAPNDVADVVKPGDVIYTAPLADAGGKYSLQQVPEINGGFICLDPHTGRVLAIVGGFSFFGSEFDRATQAWRQTGSAFKPVVYAAALDHGFTPSSIIIDGPFVAAQGAGLPMWSPENYSNDYLGPRTLRTGLQLSRNLMTVRLANYIGMDVVADYAKRLGVVDKMEPLLSYSLGAAETTVMRLAGAFAIFDNYGRRVPPTLIDRIQDRHGKTIFRADMRECPECGATVWANQPEPVLPALGEQILDPATAYQIVSLLEGVVQRGTGTALKAVGVPLAGKTGTTNDFKDAWFVGFTPDLLAGVYVGFDQPRPLGHGEAGGVVAAPIVRDFFKAALGETPESVPFRVPPGIQLIRVNASSGQYTSADDPGAILEAFKAGTDPNSGINLFEGEYGLSGEPVSSTVTQGTGGLY